MLRAAMEFVLLVIATSIIAGCGETIKHHATELPSASAIAGGSENEVSRAEATAPTTDAGLNRKIIYSATVDLVVEDFSGIPRAVVKLVKQSDAYVAGSKLTGTSGENRSATWQIRVPVARFEEFVDAAKTLGELVSAVTTSQDVNEEYYDVDARIRNKSKEEERLLKLLEERPGKLEDVIAIEHELSRVREELERMQGRLRVLSDVTSMTTVKLCITEVHSYKPPEAATLSTRLRRAFDGSLASVQSAGETSLVILATVSAWLPVVAVGAAACYYVARALWRTRSVGSIKKAT